MIDHNKQAYNHNHAKTHSHGYVHENKRAIVNRLSRAMGHLEKVRQMVEDEVDYSEVLVQLLAVRSALDNSGKVILKDYLHHCIEEAVYEDNEVAIDNLCLTVDRFIK